MIVVDSSGWMEYFTSGGNSDFFAAAIESTEQVLVPSISLYEVFKRILLDGSRDDALEAIALMKAGQVIDLDDNLALLAAEISIEHRLPMADSIILATARSHQAELWTQDAHFKDLVGVRFIQKN